MARLLPVLAAFGIALALTALGTAASVPAVPTLIQALIKARAGDTALVPTRLPRRYRYRGFAVDPVTKQVRIRFADLRFPPNGRHAFTFTTQRDPDPIASCASGKTKTLALDGNKVYWDGTVAWRCESSGGATVRIAATGFPLPPTAFASDIAYGLVVASARRIR